MYLDLCILLGWNILKDNLKSSWLWINWRKFYPFLFCDLHFFFLDLCELFPHMKQGKLWIMMLLKSILKFLNQRCSLSTNSSVTVTPAGETGSPEQVHVLLGKPVFCTMANSFAHLEILTWPSWSQPARLVMCEMDPSSRRLACEYRTKWDLAMSLNQQQKLREISGSTLGKRRRLGNGM